MTPARRIATKSGGEKSSLQFRLRIMHKGAIALGPGKIDLLAAIQTHGTISKGARSLGMSYMRAWTLVKVMNAAFRSPLVEVERGGLKGGTARLTPLGQEVLELYGQLVHRCQTASAKTWTELRNRLAN
jgi:molybdate transport system regulatory protein